MGYPHHPDLVWGVPWVLPTIQTWDGVPPHPDLRWGTPPPRPGMGYPPPTDLGRGIPPNKWGQTENITFPHPSDAGGKNMNVFILIQRDTAENTAEYKQAKRRWGNRGPRQKRK